ncbi:DUF4192 domain-containing protein [Arthrobacter sp. zg-Y820]|uniref:DUF4192 domain-containing protein n=1 Tax=unclassified Arthrobacter TaxID=235627 RepID=UPI001E626BD7|nr:MULTISPECIES: DUF4192 domain-containing protein [unclassified Arthrobacter]MCC9197817.1 DUF4192 domain-containing protein [Arthrobacter sp. zg-Y820]MDK1280684.1 DUF4192 domain-containing protein [Arthrobacter sp. zg.Y820]WIB10683.1 DUF4192 domain-containing protein [Arthrobacter sp. zg-Y820]
MTKIPTGRRPQEPFPVSGPMDILAFIPHSLGFVPQESMVLMTMDSARLGATLRLDLPPAGLNHTDFAARVTELLRSDRAANGVLMALYTNLAWQQPEVPPYCPLVTELGEHLAEAGLPIRDGWLVSAHAWREYFCTDSSCCPWPGHSLGLIADSTLSAEMVYRGSAYARSLDEAVSLDLPPAWENSADAALHRSAYVRRLRTRWCRRAQFAGTLAVWNAFFAAAAGTGTEQAVPERGCPQLRADPEAAGFLLASLRARPVRDTLLVMAALGYGRALEGAEACNLLSTDDNRPVLPPGTGETAWPAPERVPRTGSGTVRAANRRSPLRPRPGAVSDPERDFREVLIGQYSGLPDWTGMDAAFAVFAELLAATAGDPGEAVDADGEAAAALLSLLAWIEWARGRGSRAQVHLTRCLASYPGYRLAELLEDLLTTGMFPLWARQAGTAWRSPPAPHPGTARS